MDPIGNIVRFNLYQWSNNEPNLVYDLSGLAPTDGCPSKPPGACFLCMYSVYTELGSNKYVNYRYCPKKACDLANKACGSHVTCGTCGPTGWVIELPSTPLIGEGGLLKRIHDGDCGRLKPHFRIGYPNQRVGGSRSADKLAHCIGCCMAISTASVVGVFGCNTQYHDPQGRDPIEDNRANDYGKSCAIYCPSMDVDNSFDVSLALCTACCTDKTYDLHCE